MSDDTPRALSSDRDESSSSDSDEEIGDPVESLVSGREKRATAGNRLSSFLQKEADDELELLFAENEEEEDVEFEGVEDEDASDVQLGSSSDDEDQDMTKDHDELDGERELQKQDRAEKQKKRKAQELYKRPGGLRRRIKVDPTTGGPIPATPVARPRKKSERVSWIPTPEEGPTRSSTRKQTVQNKESVHLRMVESEKRRVQLIHVMEAAAKRKKASKPKPRTQAERLEEAARTERKNAKSLNRWEETEKKRSEEQRLRLEALHNRQLSGSVITWWSGTAEWVNGVLGRVGARRIAETNKDEHPTNAGPETASTSLGDNYDAKDQDMPTVQNEDISSAQPQLLQSNPLQTEKEVLGQTQERQGSNGFLDGIYYYASLPSEPANHGTFPQSLVSHGHHNSSSPYQPPEPSSPYQPPTRPVAPKTEYSSRNLVILDNIDEDVLKTPELQNHLLLKKRIGKISSEYFDSTIFSFVTNCATRTRSGALRYYRSTCKISRSKNRFDLPRFVCLQRNSKASEWRIPLEHAPRLLRGAYIQCCSRCSRTILEERIKG